MKVQKAILIVVILAALAIVVKPHVPFLNPDDQVFTVTPKPYTTYQQALAGGRPVFLEFYADW